MGLSLVVEQLVVKLTLRFNVHTYASYAITMQSLSIGTLFFL